MREEEVGGAGRREREEGRREDGERGREEELRLLEGHMDKEVGRRLQQN